MCVAHCFYSLQNENGGLSDTFSTAGPRVNSTRTAKLPFWNLNVPHKGKLRKKFVYMSQIVCQSIKMLQYCHGPHYLICTLPKSKVLEHACNITGGVYHVTSTGMKREERTIQMVGR